MASSSLCINCHSKPKFVDSTRTHDFCGRGCASQYHGNAPGGGGGGGGGHAGGGAGGGGYSGMMGGYGTPNPPRNMVHSFSTPPTAAPATLNIQPHILPMSMSPPVHAPPPMAFAPAPAPPPIQPPPVQPPPPIQNYAPQPYASPYAQQQQQVYNPGPSCLYPGCSKPPHPGGDYCSRTHRDQGNAQGITPSRGLNTGVPAFSHPIPAPNFGNPYHAPPPAPPPPPPPPLDPAKACLQCKTVAKNGREHFCSKTCGDAATASAPGLLHIPKGHEAFNDVVNQLKKSWKHQNKTMPTVAHVYKILATKASITAYDTYRASVEARGQFKAKGMSEGNERRRWHGTTRTCNLGDNPASLAFCTQTTCSLCNILRTSFKLSAFGKKTGWGRFGAGIYTSATSSKSNDYSNNPKSSPYKAIILTKVVVGRGQKITQDSTTLTGPSPGYDSVLGEVGSGGNLNYDELVVYRDDAVRPSYLVLYK